MTPPYSPPPYSAPQPQRRGCGGCLATLIPCCLLAVVGGAIGSLLLYRAAKWAIRDVPVSEVQQAEAARTIPAGVPLYPGLVLDGRQSEILYQAHVTIQVNGQPNATGQRWLSYKCHQSADVVGNWYAKRLPPLGWRLDGREPGVVSFRKGNIVFAVVGTTEMANYLTAVREHVFLMRGRAASAPPLPAGPQ